MMGGLLAASLISGAGQGLANVANTVLDVGTRSVLQNQREEMENLRLEKTHNFSREQAVTTEANAGAREQRGYTHAEGLLTRRETGDTARLDKRLTAERENHAADLASKDRIEGGKHQLATQELAMNAEYHKARTEYWRAATGRSGGGAAKKEYLESVTKPLIDNLYKQKELATTPDEKDEIQSRIDQAVDEARRVTNVGALEAPAPGQIKDRYLKLLNPAVTGGR